MPRSPSYLAPALVLASLSAGCDPAVVVDAGVVDAGVVDAVVVDGSPPDSGAADATITTFVGIAPPRTPPVIYQDFDGCVEVTALTTMGTTERLLPSAPGFALEIDGASVVAESEACDGIRLFGASGGLAHVTVRAATTSGVGVAEFDVRVVTSTFRLTDDHDDTESLLVRGAEEFPWARWVDVAFERAEPDAQALFHRAFMSTIAAEPSVVQVVEHRLVGLMRGETRVGLAYDSSLSVGAPLAGRRVVVADGVLSVLNSVVITDPDRPTIEHRATVLPNRCVRIRGYGQYVDGERSYFTFADSYELTVVPSSRLVQREPGIWCAGDDQGEVLLRLCVDDQCLDGVLGVFDADAISPALEVILSDSAAVPVPSFEHRPQVCLPMRVVATIDGTPVDVSASRLVRFFLPTAPGMSGPSMPMGGRPCGEFVGVPAGTDPFSATIGVAYAEVTSTVSVMFVPTR